MNRKESIKKWEEIVSEMEAKKSELDNLLGVARQSNEQITSMLSDAINKLNEVVSIESQVNHKFQTIEQSRVSAAQKEEEAKNKSEAILQIHSEVETKRSEITDLLDRVNDFYRKQEEKYTVLYKQIEEELKAGTTSVNLSKTFADKVGDYKWNGWLWSGCFIALLLGLVGYYGYITFTTGEIKTTEDVWRHLAFRAPFLIFGVWLAIFFGNRRAESKKLEELYKHKEVMARSFVGYKQTLEGLGDEDKTLLKQHMDNLLKAMRENSATFLNTEGDKHPVFEAISSIFRLKKETTKEE